MEGSQDNTQSQVLTSVEDILPTPSESWGRLVSLNTNFPNIELKGDEVVVGRRSKCDVCISHPALSGEHCKLTLEKDLVFIHDLSTNGTYVDGRRLGKGNRALLTNSVEIVLIRTPEEKISYCFYFSRSTESQRPKGVEAIYDLRDTLGAGAFAVVKLGIHKLSGEKFAIKIIDKKKFLRNYGTKRANALMDEVDILRKLSHKHIIKIFEAFETEQSLYLVLELVTGGDLFEQIVSQCPNGFPEPRARGLFRQMVEAISYLHSSKIAHRDLKPENILLVSKTSDAIKLSDFGLSRTVVDGGFMLTLCGTPQYLAPEILLNANKGVGYDERVDLWSLGVVLYILLSGGPPFGDSANSLEHIKKGAYTFPPKRWKNISNEAKDLVKQLLCVEPARRIPINNIYSHPWMLIDGEGTGQVPDAGVGTSTTQAPEQQAPVGTMGPPVPLGAPNTTVPAAVIVVPNTGIPAPTNTIQADGTIGKVPTKQAAEEFRNQENGDGKGYQKESTKGDVADKERDGSLEEPPTPVYDSVEEGDRTVALALGNPPEPKGAGKRRKRKPSALIQPSADNQLQSNQGGISRGESSSKRHREPSTGISRVQPEEGSGILQASPPRTRSRAGSAVSKLAEVKSPPEKKVVPQEPPPKKHSRRRKSATSARTS